MRIKFLHDPDAWDDLREPWNRMVGTAATATPFQRHEYLRIWWDTLGGGEWTGGELCIAVGYAEHGEMEGIAPLFITETPQGQRSLMFLGSIEISDYLDCIVERSRSAEFIAALVAAIDHEQTIEWDVLDLYNIPEASPTLEHLPRAAHARGWNTRREILQACPYIPLNGSWDDYLQKMDSKQRRELKRKIRRAEAYPAQVSWRFSAPHELEQDLERFMAMMATDPNKARFLSGKMVEQFRRSVMGAQEQGWLQLALLEVGDDLACGYLNFDFRDRLWIYNSGFNPDYLQLSPGWVLMGYLIQWATETSRVEVDFLRGDEEYKYRLGGIDRHIERLQITRTHP